MAFKTPRNLHSLAARAFIEDLVLESPLLYGFNSVGEFVFSCDLENFVDHFHLDPELKELKDNIFGFIKVVNKVLSNCNSQNIESIRQVLRTTDHICSTGAVILQFLYDKEIFFKSKHWMVFPILLLLQKKYPNIEKLVFETITGEHHTGDIYGRLIKFLPNLRVFKGFIRREMKCLNALRKHCHGLREINLIVNEGAFTSAQLSSLFFCGKRLANVKQSYVRLEQINLSFPHLKLFSINHIGTEQYDFFKMFLHYYPEVNFSVGLNYAMVTHRHISFFDAVLSHSVILNPDLSGKQCELTIHDLFLPFCEKSLNHWQKLESLFLSVGMQGKKAPGTSTAIGRKLESLFRKQPNIKELWIRIEGPMSEDELAEIFYPSLKAYGSRFRQISIIGIVHFMGQRSLVNIINYCPNIKNLVLIGKRITKYLKYAKIKPLKYLENLTIIWAENRFNNAVCQFISKLSIDFIKNAPNLKVLNCTANLAFLETICKSKFGSELTKLILYLHTNKPLDGVNYIKKVLLGLPKLQEVVVKESLSDMREYDCLDFDELEDCICENYDDDIYTWVKNYVGNTQIYTRYYTFEDGEIGVPMKWI